MEVALSGPEGLLAVPEGAVRCAVLVLSGSSGRVEVERARLLCAQGAAALSLRWFGGPGQPQGICEVPLETFTPALERLASLSEHLCVIGASKGAEAALLLACRDRRIRAVAALAPSSVVWANVGPGVGGLSPRPRSSWTDAGRAVPFVPYDPTWIPRMVGGLPCYRGLYEQSLVTFADQVDAATIPVERISAELLLAGGGDDQVWPTDLFIDQIAQRRAAHALPTSVLTASEAGHRIRLPGEPPPGGGMAMTRGGTANAETALGQRLWPALLRLLRLDEPQLPSMLT